MLTIILKLVLGLPHQQSNKRSYAHCRQLGPALETREKTVLEQLGHKCAHSIGSSPQQQGAYLKLLPWSLSEAGAAFDRTGAVRYLSKYVNKSVSLLTTPTQGTHHSVNNSHCFWSWFVTTPVVRQYDMIQILRCTGFNTDTLPVILPKGLAILYVLVQVETHKRRIVVLILLSHMDKSLTSGLLQAAGVREQVGIAFPVQPSVHEIPYTGSAGAAAVLHSLFILENPGVRPAVPIRPGTIRRPSCKRFALKPSLHE